jgi:hypothetical protein
MACRRCTCGMHEHRGDQPGPPWRWKDCPVSLIYPLSTPDLLIMRKLGACVPHLSLNYPRFLDNDKIGESLKKLQGYLVIMRWPGFEPRSARLLTQILPLKPPTVLVTISKYQQLHISGYHFATRPINSCTVAAQTFHGQ